MTELEYLEKRKKEIQEELKEEKNLERIKLLKNRLKELNKKDKKCT